MTRPKTPADKKMIGFTVKLTKPQVTFIETLRRELDVQFGADVIRRLVEASRTTFGLPAYQAKLLHQDMAAGVGWSIEEHMETSLVLGALYHALRRRHVDGDLLHHSDRGSQYAAGDYRKQLDAHEVVCSMSRKGNCWDNAVVESFFGTLKTAREIEGTEFATRAGARSAVADYIDNFYNTTRRHSSLGYLSPNDYEASARMGRAA